MSRTPITARVPSRLAAQASAVARTHGRGVTAIVEAALTDYADGGPRPRISRDLAAIEAELEAPGPAGTVMRGWRLPEDLLARVQARAAAEGVTRSELIVEALAALVSGPQLQAVDRIRARLEAAA